MTITTRDQLINALANNSSRILIDKASIASQAAGNIVSLWRATGQPGQGAIPAAAAVCNNTTTGAINFTQQSAPATSYLGQLEMTPGNSAMVMEIHDRLAHMGGLSGTVTTAQTVGIDFSSLTTDNLTNRIGDANYSDIQWWAEWYTATGSTAVTLTVNVTYNDGTTGALSAISLAATRPASVMIPLNGYIPSTAAGKFIRGIVSVQLSATTGSAGSFGITATRLRGSIATPLANYKGYADWAQLGLSECFNSSCLFPVVITSTTSSGTIRATGKICHG